MTTVLLVEDNPADARFASVLLRSSQYTLLSARTIAQALECTKDEKVDAVLLDLSLPDSQGIETITHMTEHRSELPIVVLTGMEDVSCAVDALKAGAHDYIVKNRLDPESLSRSINFAIEAKKRQITEERLLERTRINNVSAAVGQALVRSVTTVEMLNACAKAFVEYLDIAVCQIWTVDEQGQSLVLRASTETGRRPVCLDDNISIGAGIIGMVAAGKNSFISNCAQTDSQVTEEWAKAEGIVSFAAYPLLISERLVGVIALLAKHPLSDITINSLGAIADQVALGVERKKSDEERSKLAAIVEFSQNGIISTALDGTILSWNQAASKIYGYSAEEMIGNNISIVMVDGKQEMLRLLEKAKQGEHLDGHELVRVRKDGTKIDISLTLSPIRDENGIVIGASSIVRDITRRKRFEFLHEVQNEVTRILSQAESIDSAVRRILELLTKSAPSDYGALWRLDREANVLKCISTWFEPSNAAFQELASLSRHVVFPVGPTLPGRVLESGKPAFIPDLSSDKGFARAQCTSKVGLVSGVAFPVLLGTHVLGVVEFFNRDGKEPEADFYQMMSSVGAQLAQFLDRHFAEQAAKQAIRSEQRIAQAIMENAPIGISWLNRNLTVSGANQAFRQQFAPHNSDLEGTFIFQLPVGIPNDKLVDVIHTGVPFSSNNFKVSMPDSQGSQEKFFDLTVWPVKDDEQQNIGLVLLTVEVTERVKLGKQREDFVATLTHDLKNPLIGQNRILGLILKEDFGPVNEEQEKILSLMKTGTDELLALIGTLLEVYRYEEGAAQLRPYEFDLVCLISSCVSQMTPIANEKGINIIVAFEAEPVLATADEMALRRVIMNLLDNAIKFTPAQGLVGVNLRASASRFHITVEDNGAGINEKEMKTLFQRFSQTRQGPKHKASTGLGLYLCRQIVEAHGGEISCSSAVGVGTKFIATLPLNCQRQVES